MRPRLIARLIALQAARRGPGAAGLVAGAARTSTTEGRAARTSTTGRRAAAAAAVAVVLVGFPAPAHAESRVTVANPAGDAVVDPTYATTLTVSGRGFQSIRGGFGGIYVVFGTVDGRWRPSQGGTTGEDYLYVPDSESAQNHGFQRFLAFPGSDTASSANGTIGKDGSWSTTLVVPGAVFEAYDRDGNPAKVDCRTVGCGVITLGAHGVVNARNETFTPVTYADLTAPPASAGSVAPSAAPNPATASPAPATGSQVAPRTTARRAGTVAVAPVVTPTLEVDRSAATAGNVLAFSAAGLSPGAQVSAVFDDGAAGAGPFVVGADGSLAGVLTLPVDTGTGTHELRLFGLADAPSVSFGVSAAEDAAAVDATVESAGPVSGGADGQGLLFAGGAGLVLLLAATQLVLRRRSVSRAS